MCFQQHTRKRGGVVARAGARGAGVARALARHSRRAPLRRRPTGTRTDYHFNVNRNFQLIDEQDSFKTLKCMR